MKLGRVPGSCLGEATKYCSQQSNREMYMEDRNAVAAGLQKADIADQGYRRRLREKKSGGAHKRKAQLCSGVLDLSECSVDTKFKCSDQQRNRIFGKAKVTKVTSFVFSSITIFFHRTPVIRYGCMAKCNQSPSAIFWP
jgi:hypothetical protein